jgi:TorA maturation chaperone TorD
MNPKANPSGRAEFYLCLARAFAPPTGARDLTLLREELPADLQDLAVECGYDLADALAGYRAAISAVPDGAALLVTYSRLFLVPGDRHPALNTGVYLDGAVGGDSVRAMETCYQRCGLEKHENFPDLPDHLSVQLEFVAWLLGAEMAAAEGQATPPLSASAFVAGQATPPLSAAEFLQSFVARWVRPFREDIAAAEIRFGLRHNPYLALARLLEIAVLTDLASLTEQANTAERLEGANERATGEVDPEIDRLRRHFAGRIMAEEDLAFIRERLVADGLPTGHVAIPVEKRDRVMGMEAMTPPQPQSHQVKGAD